MGKNKRKKKQREEDFKKVKLKVGKKLPKGANETQTSFKSQGIVIPSQDLTKEGQLTNTRKQGLKDLIPHLSHYSPTVRQEALLGLRSLFQQHIHIFQENLSLILGPIAAKMTDTDSDVRHSLLLLLRYILPHLPCDQAAPFLPLLVAHLSCAMSHIYEDIQLESLEFFSLFLELFPKQISANSSQLLDNFIGLISQHSGGTLNQKSSKGSTKIAVNPKGKLSSPKARLKILTQLYEFLKALYAEITAPTQTEFTMESVSSSQCLKFSQTKLTYKSLLRENDKEPKICMFSFGDQKISLENTVQNNKDTRETSGNTDVKEFMQKIVPLLLEFWVECNPSQLSTSLPDNALPAVNLSIMLTVMNILKILLHKLFKMEGDGDSDTLRNWLVSQYFKEFNMHFMKLFPFQDSLHSKAKSKAKLPESNSGNSTLNLNISVCEVMSYFIYTSSVSAKQPSKNMMEQLEDFVVHSLEQTFRDKGSLDQLKGLLVYVEKVLQRADNQEESNSAVRILGALYKLYKSSHLLSGLKNMLLKFFGTLITRQKPVIGTQQDMGWQGPLKQWISTLPKLLVQLKTSSPEMTYTVLKVLSRQMKQNTGDIDQKDLQKQLNSFLDPTSGPFCKLSKEIQNTTAELLFTLPVINNCLLKTLSLCCHQQDVSVDVIKYLIQVLHYRSPASCGFLGLTSAFTLSSYLSFLFSVAIGYTREQLHNYQANDEETALLSYNIVEDRDIIKRWTRHQDILQAVCSTYIQLQNADQLLHVMEPVLKMTLDETRILPLTVADSLLQLCSCYTLLSVTPNISANDFHHSSISSCLISSLAGLSITCMLYSTKTDDTMKSNLVVKNCLFSDVMKLLMAQPSILEKLLDDLLSKTPDLSHEVTNITTSLLQAFGDYNNPMFYSVAVETLINKVVEKLRSQENQTPHFSDLAYQCSLYCIEVNRRKEKQ